MNNSLNLGPAAQAPTLEYVFTVEALLLPPLELGYVDGGQKRFIAITGGRVSGPRLNGEILPGGGDWQVVEASGVTWVEARYFLRADDGTVIEVTNPGKRVASPEVTTQLARGEEVDPSDYYFRTTPRFAVQSGPHEWLRSSIFIARGIRKPKQVLIDFYRVT